MGSDARTSGAPRCRLCGGPVAFALSAPDRTRPGGPRFDYDACADCGCLQLAAIPDDLASRYDGDYYTARQRVPRPRAGGRFGARRLWTRMRLALPPGRLSRAASGRRYGRFDWFRRSRTGIDDPILDVGCGSGRLLFRLRGEGFRCLVGIDPQLAPGTADGADGRPGLRFEACPPSGHAGAYRLVMAHHSFEHMREPLREFDAMAALVAPGGTLLLRVPLADGWARERYGADWAQLDAPRHLQIPTRRTIERLAARAGLVVDHVEDDSGVFQIVGSERAPEAGPLRRTLRALAARRIAARLRRAGRGDQAAFYLRRAR